MLITIILFYQDTTVTRSDRTTCHLINNVSNPVNAIHEVNESNEVNTLQHDDVIDHAESKTHMMYGTMPRLLCVPLVKMKTDHGPIKVSLTNPFELRLLHICTLTFSVVHGFSLLKAFGSGIRSALLRDITIPSQSTSLDSQAPLSSSRNNQQQQQQQQQQQHQPSVLKPSQWYRLKGCGAPDGKGFTVSNVLDDTGAPVTTGTGETTKPIRYVVILLLSANKHIRHISNTIQYNSIQSNAIQSSVTDNVPSLIASVCLMMFIS